MSEGVVTDDGVTAGTLLRQAREEAGMHVATLAAILKVPVRKLEALEEDRYDLLSDAVFVRGLASSVCRTLKIDPQPVLERLPHTAQPRLVPDHEGLNEPFRAPSDGPGPGLFDQVSKPVLLTVAVLLLGALVLVFQPMLQSGYQAVADANRSPDPVMPPPGAAPAGPGTSVVVESVPAAPGAPAQPAPGAAPVTSAAAPVPAAPATPAPGASAAAPAATAVAPVPAPALPAASGPINARGIVVFRTRAQSWIQVTDATGTTVFRKLMEPGESAGAGGALPLSVTVGSVEATEVQVRGKPYNLAPVSKDNVARFEVK